MIIFSFLYIYLLNHSLKIDPNSKPSVVAPNFTGHFRITAETPRGFTPFIPNIPVQMNTPSTQSDNEATGSRSGLIPGPFPMPVQIQRIPAISKNIFQQKPILVDEDTSLAPSQEKKPEPK